MANHKYILFLSLATLTSLSLAVSSIFIFSTKKEQKVDEIIIYSVDSSKYDAMVKIDVNPKNIENANLNIDVKWSSNVKDKSLYRAYLQQRRVEDYLKYNVDDENGYVSFKKIKLFSCPIELCVSSSDDPNISSSLTIDCAKELKKSADAKISRDFIDGQIMDLKLIEPQYSEGTIIVDDTYSKDKYSYSTSFVDKGKTTFKSLFNEPFYEYEKVKAYSYNGDLYDNYLDLKNAISNNVENYFFATLDYENVNRNVFSLKELTNMFNFQALLEDDSIQDRQIIDRETFIFNYRDFYDMGMGFKTTVNYDGKKIKSVLHNIGYVTLDNIVVDDDHVQFWQKKRVFEHSNFI